jgi:DNA-nicking Smr family endonuclease
LSKSNRDLTAEERRLWREVAKSVRARRSPPQDEEATSASGAAAAPKKKTAKAKSTIPAGPEGALQGKPKTTTPPANRGAEKKVRRGKLEIDASLDLHGHTQDRAQAALQRFLRAAQARGDRTVIVITGVGRGGEGVIRRRFIDWIAAPALRGIVAGYAPAHRAHGGAGAFYVFVKRTI